jgi:hypothetical protein
MPTYYQEQRVKTDANPIKSQLSTTALCAAKMDIIFPWLLGHLLIHDLVLTTARHRPSGESSSSNFAAASLGRIVPWTNSRSRRDFAAAPPQAFDVGNGASTNAACAIVERRRG